MKSLFILCVGLFTTVFCKAQLIVTDEPNAQALAQKLVGEGISISNVTFTGNPLMAGYFKNLGNNSINIDSGIVLTSGRLKSLGNFSGVNGDGVTIADNDLADNQWSLPGDADLASAIGVAANLMQDACVLEFDFVPTGDSVKFNYVFSSEEYTPAFACSPDFNDAFGFFISGPGIAGLKNIALVPNTNLPVSISNVNNVMDFSGMALCPQNPSLYQDNTNNVYFVHDGHTAVFTAHAKVTPCNVYHLKLVISDNFDDMYDSGVFLEAKSLTSNIVTFQNQAQTDVQFNSYLVEGCTPGTFTVKRPTASNQPLSIRLAYGGTAVNGVDIQAMPAIVTIPANDSMVTINVIPVVDNVSEGTEFLKVYALTACGASTIPIDSTIFQIKDYDTLGLSFDSTIICRNNTIQVSATAGYTSYQWSPATGLSQAGIYNPQATPTADSVTYTCTSQVGNCHGRDSIFISWKKININSVGNVNCQDAATGFITVSGSGGWINPIQYSLDHQPYQAAGNFNNLVTGTYTVFIKDAGTCVDSAVVNIIQSFPNLSVTDTIIEPASCSGNADGVLSVTGTGGNPPYRYSLNGGNFQLSSNFNVHAGLNSITIKDANGCTLLVPEIDVPYINDIQLSTGIAPVICEGKSAFLPATSNALTFLWSPVTTLSDPSLLNPEAKPIVTTKYYITAFSGICNRKDSVWVMVNPAPIPDAGPNDTICFGGETSLHGSGGISYSWDPTTYLTNSHVADPDVKQPLTIDYYLTVTDNKGCTSLKPDKVTLTVPPPVKLFAGRDTVVSMYQPLQLMAEDVNATGFIYYSWEPSRDLNNAFIKNPVARLSDFETQFIVTAKTAANCIGTDTLKVKTYKGPDIYVANSFTPNDDGTNDVLRAFPVGTKSFHYFRIFNRYGKLVFTTNNPQVGWNGRIDGVRQKMGSFVWIAEAEDFNGKLVQRKGSTILIQ